MEQLWNDLTEQLTTYYYDLITFLPKLGLAVLVFLLIWVVANWLRTFSRNRLIKRMDDPLLANFLARTIKIGLVIFGMLVFLTIIGKAGIATSILAGAGVSAFVIGFALKDIGENFLAGIMMAFNRPFRIGDTVETNGITGSIIGMNLRDTQIKTFDGKDVFMPNGAILKNPLTNFTIDGYLRQDFTIGLDYGEDVEAAERLIISTLKTIDGILDDDVKNSSTAITGMSASALDLKVYFWIDTFDKKVSGLRLKTQAIDKCLTALNEAGFYLPGDVIEMKNYKDAEVKMKSRAEA
ncbi:MAG: mechanosensitive ion channel family protein [Saprospiraceae bacterium]